MKLTNNRSIKSAKGMTLIELTVVILVLLSLISILFVGARAWKKGADRAASVMIIRNAQQAVRSYANLNNKNEGESFTVTEVFGPGKFMEKNPLATGADAIKHPAGDDFSYVEGPQGAGVVPNLGSLYIQSSGSSPSAGAAIEYDPTDHSGW